MLKKVLNDFADTLALRKGGLEGIKKAIDSKNVATIVYSSGLQVSGIFTEIITDSSDSPVYIKTTGPTNLAYDNKELTGHNKSYHAHGFGSPIGKLLNSNKSLALYNEGDLVENKIIIDNETKLVFSNGIEGYDLNTEKDWIYAEYLISKNKAELPKISMNPYKQ